MVPGETAAQEVKGVAFAGGAGALPKRVPEKTEREPKEKRAVKRSLIDATTYGIKIYAPESKPFPSIVKYEDVAEGIEQKHYKLTYNIKKQEQDVISL